MSYFLSILFWVMWIHRQEDRLGKIIVNIPHIVTNFVEICKSSYIEA